MKGLLLKDLYALWGYMKAFLFLELLLSLCARFTGDSSFLVFYPCILSGLLSMSLIACEENEKWSTYVLTLPCSRRQVVSAKYLLSLGLSLGTTALILLVQLTVPGRATDIRSLFLTLLSLSLLPPAVLLPFVYKLGAEKGRLAYYMVMGGFCGLLALLDTEKMIEAIGGSSSLLPGNATVLLMAIGIFACSWLLSIRFYQNREL